MIALNKWVLRAGVLILLCGLVGSCGFRRKKYENPITKDTQQPDKALFDKAVGDMERGRYEIARLTLQTLMNTYDTSEYLAKAKLAYADSWYREGGSHGLAQAEAEYKDFILFYPTLEESAEAQSRVCDIHMRQMEKPDRDMMHALRAEDECRNLVVQFPNSKFAPGAQQKLREIQEVIAEGEFRRGFFYHHKGSHPAAANRLQALVDHYPLYSQADQANWILADSYSQMGPRFRQKAGDAYARIVRDYPLSPYSDDAKKQLQKLEMPIPEVDQVAYSRMKYELENREKQGPMDHFWGVFKKNPDVSAAAKSGQPAMTSLRPTIPASVPLPAQGGTPGAGGFTGDVSAATVVESGPAESTAAPAAAVPSAAGSAAPADGTVTTPAEAAPAGAAAVAPDGTAVASPINNAATQQQLPTNHTGPAKKKDKKQKTPSK